MTNKNSQDGTTEPDLDIKTINEDSPLNNSEDQGKPLTTALAKYKVQFSEFSETAGNWMRKVAFGEWVFAIVTLALGIMVIVLAGDIRMSNLADVIGARTFPVIVGWLLIGSAVLVAVDLLRGKRGEPEDGEDIDPNAKTDWITVVKIIAFLLIHIYTIRPLGWWLAAAILFTGIAWSLGTKKIWQAAIYGLTIGLIIQITFGVGLGLSLPNGPLLDWIPFFRG